MKEAEPHSSACARFRYPLWREFEHLSDPVL